MWLQLWRLTTSGRTAVATAINSSASIVMGRPAVATGIISATVCEPRSTIKRLIATVAIKRPAAAMG